jgi:hypothetical protein
MTAIVGISATPEHTAAPGVTPRGTQSDSGPGAGIGVFSISAPGIPLLVRAETQHPLWRCLAPSEAFQVRRIRERRRVYPYRVCKTNAAS